MLLSTPLKCCKYPLSCTCILVEVSTVLTEDGRKDVLAFFCHVVVCEAISVHARCVITLDALWLHSSSPPFAEHTHHGSVPWPSQCLLWCVSNLLMLLETRPGWSRLMPSPSQHLPEKGKLKISMWHFLPTTWRQTDVTVENGWPCSYWPWCLPCLHSPCDSCNLPQLPAFSHSRVCLKNCLLCLDCVCLPFHTTAVKSPLVITQISPFFSLWVLVFRSLGIPFLCSLSVPQQ